MSDLADKLKEALQQPIKNKNPTFFLLTMLYLFIILSIPSIIIMCFIGIIIYPFVLLYRKVKRKE